MAQSDNKWRPLYLHTRARTCTHTHTHKTFEYGNLKWRWCITYLLTSSADCAMKNPCVLACILAPRGLMEILLSLPFSPLISMARSSNFSFVKHNLLAYKIQILAFPFIRRSSLCEYVLSVIQKPCKLKSCL